MAVAFNSASSWGLDNGSYYPVQTLTTGTISPPANSIIALVGTWADYVYSGGCGINTPTNTGTSLTWNLGSAGFYNDGMGETYVTGIYYALNTSAQTNITVSATTNGNGYAGGGIKAYVFTGHNTSSQLDQSFNSGLTGYVSTVAGGMLVAIDQNFQTSTDLTYSQNGNGLNRQSTAGYKSLGAAGTYSFNLSAPFIPCGIVIKAASTATTVFSVDMLGL